METLELRAGRSAALATTRNVLRFLLIAVVLIFFLFPIYWIVIGSFKRLEEFYRTPPAFWPDGLFLGNYGKAFSARALKGLVDSLIVGVMVTILTMIIATPAAYSIARYRPGGTNISFFILSIMFLPPVVGLLPLFFIFKTLRLIDTYWVLFISHLFINLPFCTWLMKGFFEDIPAELEQAAMLDGYSRFRVFFKIAIPLARAGMAVAALFAFIFSWNEFMFATIFEKRNVQTLPLVLADFTGATGVGIIWGELCAVAVMAALPGILLAIFMQRYVVRGLTFGAIKK
jgi:multiple sugar transport system permease protein